MEAWLQEVGRQFPILAVAGGIAFFAFKHICSQHDRQLAEMQKAHEKHLQSLLTAHTVTLQVKDQLIVAKDAELERLRQDMKTIQKERDGLNKQLREQARNP
jgi:septal ring factor EnvC (AmiA/AmiB activator)